MESDSDPFGTAELRAAVESAWASSPTRFREDANAEDDLVRGAYRDRLVVELAQNAADAATAAGDPGRLLLRCTSEALVVANTGHALTAQGVRALASLRASAKSVPAADVAGAASVGRFGIGFAAVLAVTDSPRVASRDGGVAFSAEATARAVAAIPHAAEQAKQRGGHVPVLRLPFANAESPLPGFDTTVVLPWRDDDARELGRQALAAIDVSLLLSLPALDEVVVDTDSGLRTLRRAGVDGDGVVAIVETRDGTPTTSRWLLSHGSGVIAEELRAKQPIEDRGRPSWWWTWAVPVDADGAPRPLPESVPATVHAPTPTDERLDLPALLLASFPLDPSRRGILPGALSDRLAAAAAAGYARLVAAVAAAHGATAATLVPGPVGVSAVDGQVRHAIRAELPGLAVATAVDAPGRPVLGAELRALDVADERLLELLSDAYAGLVGTAWLRDRTALTVLSVPAVQLADVLDEVGSVHRPPQWWRDLYAALDDLLGTGRITREQLDGLSVPLADGRTVGGPHGTLLSGPGLDASTLGALGLRVVEPAAAHRLLERLGAAQADAQTILDDPAIRQRLLDPDPADDASDLARAVLGLLAGSPHVAAGRPWLRFLELPDERGDWRPARDLMLPDAVAGDDLEPGETGLVDGSWVDDFGADVLRAVGVVDDLAVVTTHDVSLDLDLIEADDDADPALDADGFADWAQDVRLRMATEAEAPPSAPEATVVLDLDLVRDDAWPRVLRRLAARDDARSAIVRPTRVVADDGRAQSVPSYSAWWLSTAPLFDGQPPTRFRLADSDPRLADLYAELPRTASELDEELLTAIGVRSDLLALLVEPDGAADLLQLLSDPALVVVPLQLESLFAALGSWAGRTPPDSLPSPPQRLRVVDGTRTTVVDRRDCVVVGAPHHLPLAGPHPIAGSVDLAELLDVDLFEPTGVLGTVGQSRPVPEAALTLLGGGPEQYVEHDDLVVDGCRVQWWVTDDGQVHASTVAGLGRALAWHSGQWSRRWQLVARLSEPEADADFAGEDAFDAT